VVRNEAVVIWQPSTKGFWVFIHEYLIKKVLSLQGEDHQFTLLVGFNIATSMCS
jgi:hypothetical protein